MTTLDILICTIDAGIIRVPSVLLPRMEGVTYVVSMQYTDDKFLQLVPQELRERTDVVFTFLSGRGLSRNRNNAFDAAAADVVLIADDDVRLSVEGVQLLRRVFDDNPRVDIALFRMNKEDGTPMKKYPKGIVTYEQAQKDGYYPSSVEMAMRGSVVKFGLQFDERFGLGASYLCCGEEEVFLRDAQKKRMRVRCYPITLGCTLSGTTGSRFLQDVGVRRSKGAMFEYCYGGLEGWWRCVKESLYYFLFKGRNPFPLYHHMRQGARYIQRTSRR